MSKFSKEILFLTGKDCNFLFYRKGGSYGMYCRQVRLYSFCIPLLIGFTYKVSWGYDL